MRCRRMIVLHAFIIVLVCGSGVVNGDDGINIISRHHREYVDDIDDDDLVVTTTTGRIKGIYTAQRSCKQFLSIPYATPPTGDRRWTVPIPETPWSGVLATDKMPPGCIQKCHEPKFGCPPSFSEDCLYLNVYAPASSSSSDPFPVILFMHGGNFRDGGAGAPVYNASYPANATEVIWVVINYRLGALGYLASRSRSILGNMGVSDQRAALLWVQQNIAAFGGDPTRVTLTGQSAGAVSTVVHMISEMSEGLFHQAIIESEPYGIPIRDSEEMYNLEESFASLVKCSPGDVACYATKNSSELLAAQEKIMTDAFVDPRLLSFFMPFTPIIDGYSIPMDPYLAFVNNNVRPMPMIQGNTAQEGNLFVYSGFTKPVSSLEYDAILVAIFGLSRYSEIHKEYPPPANAKDVRLLASNLTTDAIFLCVNRNGSLSHSDEKQPTWYYVFDHPSSFNARLFPSFCVNVSCHGSDLPYVFSVARGMDGFNFTENEYVLSDTIVQFWGNFAHSANPNKMSGRGRLGKRAVVVEWPQFDDTLKSMHFTTPLSNIKTAFDHQKCDFWDKVGYEWE